MDDQSGAFTAHSRLHGRSLKRSAPRNTHTRLFIESSPASRPFGAATTHAKDARPGEKEKARKDQAMVVPNWDFVSSHAISDEYVQMQAGLVSTL